MSVGVAQLKSKEVIIPKGFHYPSGKFMEMIRVLNLRCKTHKCAGCGVELFVLKRFDGGVMIKLFKRTVYWRDNELFNYSCANRRGLL